MLGFFTSQSPGKIGSILRKWEVGFLGTSFKENNIRFLPIKTNEFILGLAVLFVVVVDDGKTGLVICGQCGKEVLVGLT